MNSAITLQVTYKNHCTEAQLRVLTLPICYVTNKLLTNNFQSKLY